MYYVSYFFLYSILGHFIESIIYLFDEGSSGILYGYWTPIYGIGTILILYIYNNYLKNKKHKYIYIFLIGFILLSLIELLGGILIEKIFGEVFWSYKNLKFNFGHYVSLEISLIWGLLSVMVIYIKRYIDPWICKIPKYIDYILILLFLGDILFVIFQKIFF